LLPDLAVSGAAPANLFANYTAQSLIAGYGLAVWQALAPHLPAPVLVAGYSVGEMTACHVAGWLEPVQLLTLVQQRARAMDGCGGAQAMLATSGMAAPQLAVLLEQFQAFVAIDNGGGNVVLGAALGNLQALAPAAVALGARVQWLPVHVASHTPLLQAAQPVFLANLQGATWQAPQCALLSGIDAQMISQTRQLDQLQQSLAQQLCHTVRWGACMEALVEARVDVVLELGPGSALARMLQARQPDLPCRSLADFRSFAAALAWLARQG
jgi:[acyl-carrier-protein] S-malonyltransferase